VNKKVFDEASPLPSPDREEMTMGCLTRPAYEKGFAVGYGETMSEWLETRFGPLPAEIHERIRTADIQSLRTWFDRAFDAPDLRSIFESK
jgi:hypothetical protein